MLITSHLLATLLASKALGLNKTEVVAALAAGVGVDLDHAFVNQKWLTDIKEFFTHQRITYGINQHSWLQEFAFGLLVATPLGLVISRYAPVRWWVLPLFLFLHIAMDAVMRNAHQPFAPFSDFTYVGWLRSGTPGEILISGIGLLLYFLL